MRSNDRTPRAATPGDLLALPDDRAAEIVDGDIVEKAAPTYDHGAAQSGLAGVLFGFRGTGGPRGPGGWWLASEVEVNYEGDQVYRHDLVGWRRERVSERPTERPVLVRPDWVCEILSPTNASTDTVKKLRVLQKHAVPHCWLLDPQAGTLRVLRWTSDGYLEALGATVDERVRAEPFDAIELSLAEVFDRQ